MEAADGGGLPTRPPVRHAAPGEAFAVACAVAHMLHVLQVCASGPPLASVASGLNRPSIPRMSSSPAVSTAGSPGSAVLSPALACGCRQQPSSHSPSAPDRTSARFQIALPPPPTKTRHATPRAHTRAHTPSAKLQARQNGCRGARATNEEDPRATLQHMGAAQLPAPRDASTGNERWHSSKNR